MRSCWLQTRWSHYFWFPLPWMAHMHAKSGWPNYLIKWQEGGGIGVLQLLKLLFPFQLQNHVRHFFLQSTSSHWLICIWGYNQLSGSKIFIYLMNHYIHKMLTTDLFHRDGWHFMASFQGMSSWVEILRFWSINNIGV